MKLNYRNVISLEPRDHMTTPLEENSKKMTRTALENSR